MTSRQRQLLDAIDRLTANCGYPPTMRELAPEVGVSLTRIAQLMAACEKAGFIQRGAPRVSRCYRVVWPTKGRAAGKAVPNV